MHDQATKLRETSPSSAIVKVASCKIDSITVSEKTVRWGKPTRSPCDLCSDAFGRNYTSHMLGSVESAKPVVRGYLSPQIQALDGPP